MHNIQVIESNKEKQKGYQKLMSKYKNAIENGYYAEAEMIVYAFLEDRLRSLLYYLGAIKPWNRQWLVDDAAVLVGQVSSLNDMGTKTTKIASLIKKAKSNSKSVNSNGLLISLRNALTVEQMNELIDIMKKIDKWREFRNEITHAWFNKDLDDLNGKFKNHVIEGYDLGKRVDNYAGRLKRKAKANSDL